MKRLLLYVHFNKNNELDKHVLYQLKHMRPLFERLVFLSNSPLSETDIHRLQSLGLADDIIQRENKGFDFAAWKEGMALVGFEALKDYESVTVMNDTCYGPLWDMAPIYDEMETDSTIDFWGLTNHRAYKGLPEHLQSYYLSFKQKVVASDAFQNFWQGIQSFDNVQDVIDHYETQVTTVLQDAGFTYQALFNTVDQPTDHMLHPDFSFYNASEVFKHKVPFIKVKAFNGNPDTSAFLIKEIGDTTSYPMNFIVSHQSKVFSSTQNYLLPFKYLKEDSVVAEPIDKKVAIHLHAYYVDLLPEFFVIFRTYPFSFDLFITTDREEKRPEIEAVLQEYALTAQILVTGNIGRDVLPMLKLKEHLENYDYIGHFHTKKSKEAEFWAGESWRRELIEMLVKPATQILANFEAQDDLGIVIADVPSYFRFVRMDPWHELGLTTEYIEKLWAKLDVPKDANFYEADTYVMSYGTYSWFKYDALKPLFDLGLTDKDVPGEPLPQGTILHAIERMLVYIAWAQGYDFRISKNPWPIPPFLDNRVLNRRRLEQFSPYSYIDFTYFGGLKGALKYMRVSFVNSSKYILRRVVGKVKGR